MAVARPGAPARAEQLLTDALDTFREIGERRWIAHTRSFQGLLALWREDRAEALAAFREALLISRELGVQLYVAEILERLAALLVKSGEAEDAARFLGAASALREAIAAPSLPVDRLTRDQVAAAAQSAMRRRGVGHGVCGRRTRPLGQVIDQAMAIMTELELAAAPESSARSVGTLPLRAWCRSGPDGARTRGAGSARAAAD